MKPLSETYKKLGIDFTFPIEIKDANGNTTYYEASNGRWYRREYDNKGNRTYHGNSSGICIGIPRSESCDGKVVEIDGQKYELKLTAQ